MKKVLTGLICIIFLFVLVGCGKNNATVLEEKLTEMGNDYYTKYMKSSNLNVAVISLKDFKEANEVMDEAYDLSTFTKCNDETSIMIYLKNGTNQIEKYEFDLKCEN